MQAIPPSLQEHFNVVDVMARKAGPHMYGNE